MKKLFIAVTIVGLLMFSLGSSVWADDQADDGKTDASQEEQEMNAYYESLLTSVLDITDYKIESGELSSDVSLSEGVFDATISGGGLSSEKKLTLGMTFDEVSKALDGDLTPHDGFEDQEINRGLLIAEDYKTKTGKKISLSFTNKKWESCLVKDGFLCSIGYVYSASDPVKIQVDGISTGASCSEVVEKYGKPSKIRVRYWTDYSERPYKQIYYMEFKYNWKTDRQIGDVSFQFDHDELKGIWLGASMNED